MRRWPADTLPEFDPLHPDLWTSTLYQLHQEDPGGTDELTRPLAPSVAPATKLAGYSDQVPACWVCRNYRERLAQQLNSMVRIITMQASDGVKPVMRTWVKALRNSRYRQNHGSLRSSNSFCCLEVLCDLHARKMINQWQGNKYLRWALLTVPVQRFAGLISENPAVRIIAMNRA